MRLAELGEPPSVRLESALRPTRLASRAALRCLLRGRRAPCLCSVVVRLNERAAVLAKGRRRRRAAIGHLPLTLCWLSPPALV